MSEAENGHGIGPVTTATTAAAAAVTVLAWVLASVAGVEIPAEVQGSLTVLAVVVAGYLTPGRGKRRAAQ